MLILFRRRMVPVALGLAVGLGAVPAGADETSSRWIAALPFGAGQVHRGDIGMGVFFAVGEAVLGGTAITAAWMNERLVAAGASRPADDHPQVDLPRLNDQIRTATMVNHLAFAGWAALTTIGVLEAQVQLSVRSSESAEQLSPPVSITAAVAPGGGSIHLQMAF